MDGVPPILGEPTLTAAAASLAGVLGAWEAGSWRVATTDSAGAFCVGDRQGAFVELAKARGVSEAGVLGRRPFEDLDDVGHVYVGQDDVGEPFDQVLHCACDVHVDERVELRATRAVDSGIGGWSAAR